MEKENGNLENNAAVKMIPQKQSLIPSCHSGDRVSQHVSLSLPPT